MRKRDDEKNKREIFKALSLILQIGLSILVCMAMSMGIGYYLDKLFNTRFIILIVMVIGFLAAIRSMLVLTGKYKPGQMNKDEEQKEDQTDSD